MVGRYGPHNPDETYVPHGYPEQLFDTGELLLNHVTAGEPRHPALLLIPGQTELVGLRGGDRHSEGELPGLRRRPSGPGPLGTDARTLHPRQHGQ